MRAGAGGKDGHLAAVDLLRLLAAVSVVAFHFLFRGAAGDGYLAVGYPEAAPIALYGYLGVNLFFLISGFVIAWSAEGRRWDEFALARFIRLYPGFVIGMSLTFVVMLLWPHRAFPVSFGQYAANLTMFSPALGQPFMDGVYWSIVLELVFYGWMTLALASGGFRRCKLELIAGWLVVSLLNETLIGSGALRMLLITEFAPYFAAGMLVRHMQVHGRSGEALMLFAAAFALSCYTMQVTRDWMVAHYGIGLGMTELIAANAAIHGLLVGAVILGPRLRLGGWTIAAGGLTYPLYLVHQHVGYTAIDRLEPLLGRWPAAVLVAGVLAAVSWGIWRLLEIPAQWRLRAALAEPLADLRTNLERRWRARRVRTQVMPQR
jgi:peptidoglycan/LPS O-acetylase OafA/YrhL